MAKGKYARSSDARRAREDAIKNEALAQRDLTRAKNTIAELESELKTARLDIAAGTSAKVAEYEAKLEQHEEDRLADRQALKNAEGSFLKAYSALVAGAMAQGLGPNAACDHADKSLSGVILKGRWYEMNQVSVELETSGVIRKLRPSVPQVMKNRTKGMRNVVQRAANKEYQADVRRKTLGDV